MTGCGQGRYGSDGLLFVVPSIKTLLMRSLFYQLTIGILLCWQLPALQAQSAWRIEPGKYIGKTLLGDTPDKISARLGNADGGDAAMGKAWSLWYSRHKDNTIDSSRLLAIYFTRDEKDRMQAREIRINTPAFKTLAGIKVGSPLVNIKRAFPYVKKAAVYEDAVTGKRIELYDEVRRGITFELTQQKTGSPVCTAITVHESGKGIVDQYMAFPAYENFKKIE